MKTALKIVGLILIFVGTFVGGYLSPIGGNGSIPLILSGKAEESNTRDNAPQPKPIEVSTPIVAPLVIHSISTSEAGTNMYDIKVVASAEDGVQLQYILTTPMGEQIVSPQFGISGDICNIGGVPATDDGIYILTVSVVGDPSRTQTQNVSGLVRTVNTMPSDINVVVAPRQKNKPKQINRQATISIQDVPGEFVCIVKNVTTGEEVRRQNMLNGRVTLSVPPIDGGQYLIVVRNNTTGEEANVQAEGFDKISKWSQDKVNRELNSDHHDMFLRHHFNLDNLKISCVGNNVVTSLEELLEVKANGGTIQVKNVPEYDKYNRITNLTIQINY